MEHDYIAEPSYGFRAHKNSNEMGRQCSSCRLSPVTCVRSERRKAKDKKKGTSFFLCLTLEKEWHAQLQTIPQGIISQKLESDVNLLAVSYLVRHLSTRLLYDKKTQKASVLVTFLSALLTESKRQQCRCTPQLSINPRKCQQHLWRPAVYLFPLLHSFCFKLPV